MYICKYAYIFIFMYICTSLSYGITKFFQLVHPTLGIPSPVGQEKCVLDSGLKFTYKTVWKCIFPVQHKGYHQQLPKASAINEYFFYVINKDKK